MHYQKFPLYLLLIVSTTLHSTTVVFLQGTSRSGKSSICTAFEKYTDWDAIGSVYFSYCLQVFNELFPEEFSCIKKGIKAKNIRHAITRNLYLFKQNVNEKNKKLIRFAAQKIQHHFSDPVLYAHHKEEFSLFSLNEIRKSLNRGLHVLADVGWYVTKEKIQTLQPSPTIFCVLVYCPFNIVINRLIQKNQLSLETGDIMNYRFFIEHLKSFSSLYDLTTDTNKAIDTIDKSTFLTCLNEIETHLPNHTKSGGFSGFMMQELSRAELKEHRNAVLKQFGSHETLYVAPKMSYDQILRTDEYSPEECAEKITTFALSQT